MRNSFSDIKFDIKFNEDNNQLLIIEKQNIIKKKLSGIFPPKTMGYCYLTELPGCCGIVVLTQVHITSKLRDLNLGKELVKVAITQAYNLGYTKILATVNEHTPKMHHILKNVFKFKEVDNFTNTRTNNNVTIYTL